MKLKKVHVFMFCNISSKDCLKNRKKDKRPTEDIRYYTVGGSSLLNSLNLYPETDIKSVELSNL